MQKKLKVQGSQKKTAVFRPRGDSQVKNNSPSEVDSNLKTSSTEQSEVEAGLARDHAKYALYLRLSGIVEDISRDSKPKVIGKSGKFSSKDKFNYRNYPSRLNLGCGYDLRKGYLNVDLQEKHNPDLCADIKSLYMLPSEYYDEIVAQDCLEHIPRTDTNLVLKEWSRLLKAGGVLKLRVPDITAAVNILASSTNINHQKGWIQMIFGSQAYTGDYHFTSFTEVLARYYLEEIGFKIQEMKLFDRWLLNIIAEKY